MLDNLILLFDRVICKIKRSYLRKIFLLKTRSKNAKNCKIYDRVNVLNNNIMIGDNVTIFHNVTFFGDGEIRIGNNVSIGQDVLIYASRNGGISIGDNVMIAAHSYIIDCDHGMMQGIPICQQENAVGPIHIGNDVWIADNCTILRNSVIEDGAVIGAKSLVRSTITKDGIAVGIPAKVIKKREK